MVSCLLGVYNHERFIVESVESVLAQARDYSAELLDIVVVDDGSTDDTPRLMEPYRDRLRYVRCENGGLLANVNRMLELARGDVLAFGSGDDFWLPGKVRRHAEVLAARPDVSLVYGDARLVDEHGRTLNPSYYAYAPSLPILRGDVRGALLSRQFLPAPAVTLRASLRERFAPIGPPAVWEDWWMFHHAAQAGPFEYVDSADVAYRQHGSNMSSGIAGQEHDRFVRRELSFRRWLLGETDLRELRLEDVLAAHAQLEAHLAGQLRRGAPAGELMPAGGEVAEQTAQRRRQAAEAAGRGDLPAQAKALVQVLALEPGDTVARSALGSAVAAVRAPAPVEVLSVALLASVEELRAHPELLTAYREACSAGDDVTLVVEARGWSEARVGRELAPLAAAHGLDDPHGPDVLVRTEDKPAAAWLGERLAALLAADDAHAAVPGVPRVMTASEVRRLVAQRARRALPLAA